MKSFIHQNFLLESKAAQVLYHDYASSLPIIDYHNHLPPKLIANNSNFNNITELWISKDHYKWRAMRTLGIKEDYISGKATDKEKFIKFAEATPYMVRNPLYHWTHMELKRYFGIDELLSKKNSTEIYEKTNASLKFPEFSTQNLLKRMNVEALCTTEDPTDTLEHHDIIHASNFDIKVSTAFRPVKSLFIDSENYNSYIDKLSEASDVDISNYADLCEALVNRMNYFHEKGCRLSDHGLEYIPYEIATENEIKQIFKNKRGGQQPTKKETEQFQTALLLFLGKAYHQLGWVQQFHLGAMRNNNTRMFNNLGPDTGWDSIGSYPIALGLSRFLDALDLNNQLTKTILYNLNPSDNEIMATMTGNFNDGSTKGKIQWGSGWWFSDQLDGMTDQINILSNMGIISCFIGMLTDSRSFLSFPRHEYFRRLVCNLFAKDIEKGLLPHDIKWIGSIVQDICYRNAKSYFNY